MTRIESSIDKLRQLSKYPMLNNLEKQTSVPKVYAFLGLVGIYFFLVFFNIAGEFLVNFAGFLVPGYYSLDALFSASKVDDTQVSLRPPFFHLIVSKLIIAIVADCKFSYRVHNASKVDSNLTKLSTGLSMHS